jgi:hypothetical protein
VDGHRFDRIAKSLIQDVSRRQGLRVFVGGLASVGATALGWSSIDAAEIEATDPVCEGRPAINQRNCTRDAFQCTRDRDCYCAKTVRSNKRCVKARNLRCPRRDECERNSDCAGGRSCIRVGGCCGPRDGSTACLELCR